MPRAVIIAAPIFRATCVFGTKNAEFFDPSFEISSYNTRSKKFFKISDFCPGVPADLAENRLIKTAFQTLFSPPVLLGGSKLSLGCDGLNKKLFKNGENFLDECYVIMG